MLQQVDTRRYNNMIKITIPYNNMIQQYSTTCYNTIYACYMLVSQLKSYGDWAFSIADPTSCNRLPPDIINTLSLGDF